MSSSCDQIPRQRGAHRQVAPPPTPSLRRRVVDEYLAGVAWGAGVVTVAVATWAVLTWLL